MGESGAGWLVAALVVAVAAAGLLAAALVRTGRRHRAATEERGWLLERERESAADAAVGAERARIAAELHDIVSHNVSLMVVQAGAAREVLTTMPDEAAAAMAAVEAAGRHAMTELRHLLGLLAPAQNGEDEPYGQSADLAPQPSLSRLGGLVDRISFAGLPVEVRISGEPRPLPAGIDVTAYRIIQEALTNALKHGDGAQAEVSVRYTERLLRIEVVNSGPSVLLERGGSGSGGGPAAEGTGVGTAGAGAGVGAAGVGSAATRLRTAEAGRGTRQADGAGRGLIGLRERLAVYGGDLDARRRLGGGYRVRARIPLDRP
ncbi:sensor histidine kinase [Kitasatospora sp. NBC_01560]|uniref:sensor histidine kinase n=1 Tax=Kitasatospora sp. NBC_01560 TaxID=2975965 RepID=UPI003863C1AF